jgi:glutathione peroxidase
MGCSSSHEVQVGERPLTIVTGPSFYDIYANDIDGNLGAVGEDGAGKISLVINVASYSQFTDSAYSELQRLYLAYKDEGFTVLAFPCNQIGQQEPDSEAEIKQFVESKFNVTFPMYSKVDVNGPEAHPCWLHLQKAFPGEISDNFAGIFIVDRSGQVARRLTYSELMSPAFESELDAAL